MGKETVSSTRNPSNAMCRKIPELRGQRLNMAKNDAILLDGIIEDKMALEF